MADLLVVADDTLGRVHIVPEGAVRAVCGRFSSTGWVAPAKAVATCPKCLANGSRVMSSHAVGVRIAGGTA